MSKVRDRQTYRWTEKEVNNAKSFHSLEEMWFEDLASYLGENFGINNSGFDAKIYRSEKIYDGEVIDVKVIESQVVSGEDELKEKSRAVKNWFEKAKKQVLSQLEDREQLKATGVKIKEKSDGLKRALKQFLKSHGQRWQRGAIALVSQAKKALVSAPK